MPKQGVGWGVGGAGGVDDLIHELPVVDMHLSQTGYIVDEAPSPVSVAQKHHPRVQLCSSTDNVSTAGERLK